VLAELTIRQLRNISALSIMPSPGINLLLGPNGAGKTSILEAMHLLALGRSFRTRSLKQLVQFEQQELQVIAKTVHHQTPIGLQYSLNSGLEIRLNNAPLKKRSDLALQLPLQLIPANCHQFFEQGPKYRRQLLDWGLFHVEPSFNFHWLSYKKVIQQRNSAIRQHKTNDEVQLWDPHLIFHGQHISEQRVKRLEHLLAEFKVIFSRLCPIYSGRTFSLKYRTGWPKDKTLGETIVTTLDRDKQLGYTRSGCHAADWTFLVDGHEPAEVFSRGQQKLFFIALCMAQIKTMEQDSLKSILLIDDISSELDGSHQEIILNELAELAVQTFITSTDNSLADIVQPTLAFSAFHVKQGQLI
jgi:DNA replication and repair protein RecF